MADSCSVVGCDRRRKSHGLCNTHNERRRKGQSLDPPVGRRGGWCDVEGCTSAHYSRGWCELHYNRWLRHGDATKSLVGQTESNFWAKVDKTDSCWSWTATRNNKGYGVFWDGDRNVLAHRYSYELNVGTLGAERVDHRCGNPGCVRPDHRAPNAAE
jgi:hypothetical protein